MESTIIATDIRHTIITNVQLSYGAIASVCSNSNKHKSLYINQDDDPEDLDDKQKERLISIFLRKETHTLVQTHKHTMASKKPHAMCIPAPSLGHIKAVLKLAKLLHHKGFHITFVNTESFHKRYLKSLSPNSLDSLPDFQFETISDGLLDSDVDPMSLLCENKHMKTLLPPFRGLLTKLNNDFTNPPVTCIVSDGFLWMFTIAAAQEIGVPIVLFETIAASMFMVFTQFRTLVQKWLVPLKGLTFSFPWTWGGLSILDTSPPSCGQLCLTIQQGS
ncbi:7-deoxyloganetin glucosyltransferase [Rosa chinensis]|uniref:7-deoxyloganetin glucosyltransferase n=1 Tax=Rosa chinensis TaxID=74649 RepID=UPI001AD8A9AD|nr:7-deoxyloganetin glucosyltransferase [Rosa chinensis]